MITKQRYQFYLKIINFLLFFFLLNVSLLFSFNLNKRITLNLKDIEIRNLLSALAREEKLNLVIPPYVHGKVSVFLDNVTLKDAFKIITNLAGYDYYIKNNIIFIDKKEKIEKFIGKEGVVSKIFYLNYAKAKDLETKIKELLTPDGKVVIDERTNSILVNDYEANIKRVKKFLETLDKPTKQVMIEAKIIIVSDEAAKQLGIQWGGSFIETLFSNRYFYGIKGGVNTIDIQNNNQEGSVNINYKGAKDLTKLSKPKLKTNYELSVPSEYAVNLPIADKPAGGIDLIFGKWGYYNLTVKLTALQSKNLAKEISSPKVLALDNEKATIGQGVEIPYSTVSDTGTNTEFKEAKLKLEVTPHITENNRISLEVNLSKDSMGQMTPDGPAINTQEINTKLILRDGETAVIGGIKINSESTQKSKVPLFGDIPLLGHLFKNNIRSFKSGVLLIFLTPKIVKNY